MPAPAIVLTFFAVKGLNRFMESARDKLRAQLNELGLPRELDVPLLVLRVSTDEPGIFLRCLSAIAFSPGRAFATLGETRLPLLLA